MGKFLQEAYENDTKNITGKTNKISIIIPVHKTVKYLSKCLNSILKQDTKNLEIILVPNGGKEEHEICNKYAKENSIIKVIHDVERGPGEARNAGIKAAIGDYIWFIDSDDWIEENSIEKISNLLKKEYDLIVFEAKTPVEFGAKKQKGIKKYLKNKFEGEILLSNDAIYEINTYIWNKLFKKSIIDEFQVEFAENGVHEDFPFVYHYCFVSKMRIF